MKSINNRSLISKVSPKLILVIVFFLLFFGASCKERGHGRDVNFYKSEEFYASGDYELAYQYMLKAAENNDPEAHNMLAWMLKNGFGVQQDYKKSVEWYISGSKLGSVKSMENLANIYSARTSGFTDCMKAVGLLEDAISLGSIDALGILSDMYRKGKCVDIDIDKSDELYNRILLVDESSIYVARKYFWGWGVRRDYAKAIPILEKRFKQEPYLSGYMLGIAYKNGYGVDVDYTRMYHCFLASAKEGNTSSQYNLAICFYNGHGVSRNKGAAIEWFKKAANKGHSNALVFLGDIYLHDGEEEIAREYYKRADVLGNSLAKQRLQDFQ